MIGLQEIDLPAESARRFDYAKFYQVTLRSSTDLRPRVVYAREVPKRWRNQPPASEAAKTASCSGLFLKTGEGRPGEEALLFAAARVAWHPTGTDPSVDVNEGMSLLGSVGMDVSLLSDVVQGKPLGYEDRECFYQLLWAASQLDPAGIPPAVASPPDIQRLLRQPDACAGELITVSGNVRRALRIEVTDADVQERFGIDHYYEMELFLPLQRPLTLTDPRDGESRSYTTFPLTVCVRQLPPELPQGPEIQHHVQVTGFYMKLWSYRSRFMEGPSDDQTEDTVRRRQISPLLIGVRVRSIERAAPHRRGFGWILASGFLAALILIGLVARWHRHSDRAFTEWRRRATHPPPDSVLLRDQEPRSRERPQ